MCRKNQLRGWAVLAFGLGLLIGNGLESAFFCLCSGIGLIIFGFCLCRRK